VSWSLKLDDPITLAKGKAVQTLCDAADHITALPRQIAELDHWQTAIACLIAAAEGKGPIVTARIGVIRALSAAQRKPLATPMRKDGQVERTCS
jgi:hypothetical protein